MILDNAMTIETIQVQEDKIIATSLLKLPQMPQLIKQFLHYSELRGINYYILRTQEKVYGVFGASAGRENDHYMQELLQDPEIKAITTQAKVKLSELLG
jgi:hypothetical protein